MLFRSRDVITEWVRCLSSHIAGVDEFKITFEVYSGIFRHMAGGRYPDTLQGWINGLDRSRRGILSEFWHNLTVYFPTRTATTELKISYVEDTFNRVVLNGGEKVPDDVDLVIISEGTIVLR